MATLKTRLSLLEKLERKATDGSELKPAIESCFATLHHDEEGGLAHILGLAARVRESRLSREDNAALGCLPPEALATLGMDAPAFVVWIAEVHDMV